VLETEAQLLQGVAGLVVTLKERLRPHFDVKWITEIFLEWEEVKDDSAVLGKRYRRTSWIIDNVRDRSERLERAELQAMPESVGCTLAVLIEAYREVSNPTKQGLPSEERKPDRMTKLLKKKGYPKAMPAAIRRWVDLLRKYEPQVLPEVTAPTPPSPNVVPLNRPRR
jgi:hypothetical protein